MKIPDKIYLNVHPDWTEGENEPEVTWSEVEDPFYNNIPYIRKDVLLEWAKWARKETDKSFNSFAREKELAFERLIKHIESL